MTVADDLATLRHALTPGNYSNGPACQAALDRVEAEIARLEERANFADAYAYRQRAEAAEAEVARLRDGLRRIDRLVEVARAAREIGSSEGRGIAYEFPYLAEKMDALYAALARLDGPR